MELPTKKSIDSWIIFLFCREKLQAHIQFKSCCKLLSCEPASLGHQCTRIWRSQLESSWKFLRKIVSDIENPQRHHGWIKWQVPPDCAIENSPGEFENTQAGWILGCHIWRPATDFYSWSIVPSSERVSTNSQRRIKPALSCTWISKVNRHFKKVSFRARLWMGSDCKIFLQTVDRRVFDKRKGGNWSCGELTRIL